MFIRKYLFSWRYFEINSLLIRPLLSSVLPCGVFFVKDFLVMAVNDAAHVRHVAVAYSHVILVKDGVEIVVWWKVLD